MIKAPKVGDMIERAVKPLAKALKMGCLDETGRLKPESRCAKNRDGINRAAFYATQWANRLLYRTTETDKPMDANTSKPISRPPLITPTTTPGQPAPKVAYVSPLQLVAEATDNGGWIVSIAVKGQVRARKVYKDATDLQAAIPELAKVD